MKCHLCYLKTTFVSILFSITYAVNGQPSAPEWQKMVSASSHGFMENKGQVQNSIRKPGMDVRYLLSGENFQLVLRENGFSYEIFESQVSSMISEATGNPVSGTQDDFHQLSEHLLVKTERFDATFIAPSPHRTMMATDPLNGYSNFYAGNDNPPVTGVSTYKTITYHNIYPKIDLVFTAGDEKNTPLRYEYKVHPGGNVKDIRLRYNSLQPVQLTDNTILLNGSFGFVKEEGLYCYQQEKNKEVPSSFILKGNVVSINVEDYDRSKLLIIDPDIAWGTYYGDDFFDDNGKEITIDAEGNILVTGETSTTFNFTTEGAFQSTFAGGKFDAFVMKWNPAGERIWTTYYGGNDRDCGFGLQTDSASNIYCSGDTRSNHLFTLNAHQAEFGGIVDVFLLKLDKNGFALWSTYFGGYSEDHNDGGIFIDTLNNLYLCGWTESIENIATPGSHQSEKGLLMDAFVAKFTVDGIRQWSTYYGGEGEDRAHAMAVDHDNNIYVAGTTPSLTGISTPGTAQYECGGALDVFLVKMDKDGRRLWGTYYGGINDEHGRECSIDKAGNFNMTGYSASDNNIATSDAWQREWTESYTNEGVPNPDIYFAKYNSNGLLLYGTYLGGTGADYGRALKIESDGSIIIAGSTYSNGLGTNGTYQVSKASGKDAFILKFNSGGQLDWFTYYGGNGMDDGEEMEVDKSNHIYLTGTVNSTTGIATPGTYKDTLTNNTVDDIMIAKFTDGCFDNFEKNNSANTAAPLILIDGISLLVDGMIDTIGDKDFYSFANSVSYPFIQVQLTNLPADYNLYLIGPDGKQVAKSVKVGLSDESISYLSSIVGTYKIKIISKNNLTFNDTACYDLLINLTPSTIQPDKLSTNVADSNKALQHIDNFIPYLEVYPNPATEQFYLNIVNFSSETELYIYDLSGRMVWHPLSINGNVMVIDISKWHEGFYILVMEVAHIKYPQQLQISR